MSLKSDLLVGDILKNSMKVLSFIFVATIALTNAQTASASVECTQRVVFGCLATGKSVVLWNALELETPVVPGIEWYVENSTGFIACGGSAPVEEGDDEWPYEAEPGSVCCIGLLVARWTHGDKSYRLQIYFYSTEETTGVFDDEKDSFVIGVLPSIPTMMEFKGILIENGDSWQISGIVIAGVLIWDPPAKTIHLLLGIDLGEGLPEDERWLPVNIVWANVDGLHEESGIVFTRARVFRHSVELLDA